MEKNLLLFAAVTIKIAARARGKHTKNSRTKAKAAVTQVKWKNESEKVK
jgi:hypothetical protein